MSLIFDLQYADDAAYPSSSRVGLQSSIDINASTYQSGGMNPSTEKTEALSSTNTAPQQDFQPESFVMCGEELKSVRDFKYLGSILSSSCNVDCEIDNRIRLASASFGKLRTRVFDNHNISTTTKITVYRTICLSVLLYCSETWTVYRYQMRKLEAFHIRCLQSILSFGHTPPIN